MTSSFGRMISLAHLTLLRCSTAELVTVADEAGFDAVGLRLMAPPSPGAEQVHAVDDRELIDRTKQTLDDTGLAVLDVEAIWVDEHVDIPRYEQFFADAAELGARYAVAMVHDPDPERAAASFAALCGLAEPYGVTVNLEFARYSAVKSIAEAAELLDRVNAANATILVDTLHFARSGGTSADLQPHRARLARYIQIADARSEPPDVAYFRDEARFGRRDPGEGGLPLIDVLSALPGHLTLSVEAPNRLLDDLLPVERATRALRATQRLLDTMNEDIA